MVKKGSRPADSAILKTEMIKADGAEYCCGAQPPTCNTCCACCGNVSGQDQDFTPPMTDVRAQGCRGQAIRVPNTTYEPLNMNLGCAKPTMMVIHWSGGWSSAQATYNVLRNRGLSCEFATDQNQNLQMQNFFTSPDQDEVSACVFGYNTSSVNIEITGAYFDDILSGAENIARAGRYEQLIRETEKAVDLTCWAMQKYNIPKGQIFGHYQLNSGKSDPGREYLQFFKDQVAKKCP
jgi:hypothetical protein